MYGPLRSPSEVAYWEQGRRPRSLSTLTDDTGRRLSAYCGVCGSPLFACAASAIAFLWVMDESGDIKLAVEEIAELPDGRELTGHPRRRNFPSHPSDEKKLGHPCLVDEQPARIAGELFLDHADDGELVWFVNTNSGRYCRSRPPSGEQGKNVRDLFAKHMQQRVEFDSLEDN